MSRKIDHIGHIVNNFDEAMDLYQSKFGLTPRIVMRHPQFDSRMAFFPFGDIEMELIEPNSLTEDPPYRVLKERGEGVFHISFRVDDYDKEVQQWKDKGFTVTESSPGGNVRIAFIGPEETKGLWIEFIEKEAE
jgi:methylmalonyl-CoA/ethylmalonyl-CoA epimerase